MQDQFINPQQIRSPFTGETARPVFNSYSANGKTYEQAIISDPVTGHIIKKGLVENKKLFKMNDMNELKYVKKITTKEFEQDNTIYNIFSSLREKVNAPARNRKNKD